MVLKQNTFRVTVLLSLLLLQACGVQRFQQNQGNVLIPAAESTRSEPAIQPSLAVPKAADHPEKELSDAPLPSDEESMPSTIDYENSKTPDISILATLLSKANKAMNSQQWLRAQRVLEQALRIEPYHPEIYISYGDVYANMGIKEKAHSMYQRALYLASDNESIKRLISQKIDLLEN